MQYPVELTVAEEGGFVVTFPDVPEAITQGEDEHEALMHAVNALETALEIYMDRYRMLPSPSMAHSRHTVSPQPLSCAKLAVYQAMLTQGMRKADLARRLNWHLPQVDRLLDLSHASKFDQIETALAALGKCITITVLDAA